MENVVKVSIIVPIYNVAKYLEECLDSLVNQTLTDIEIICINDGSTDESPSIVEKYASRDERIVYISKKNAGYGSAMNVGLREARGEYIGIVESDDFASLDMYEKLYKIAKENKLDIVKSNYYEHTDIGEDVKITRLDEIGYDYIFDPKDKMFLYDSIAHWSAIYSRELLISNEIYFRETPGACYQDVSFTYKTYLYAQNMMCLEDAYLHYRVDNQASSMKSKENAFAIFGEFEEIFKHLKMNNRVDLIKKVEQVKFIHFMVHYGRIDLLFKYAYLMKMTEILKDDESRGYIDSNSWNNMEKYSLMRKIINDYASFFKEENEILYYNRLVLGPYIINTKMGTDTIKTYLQGFNRLVVFGAGVYGKALMDDILKYHEIESFVVSDLSNAGQAIRNIPVIALEQLRPSDDLVLFVALKKSSQSDVVKMLYEKGFRKI